MSKPTGRPSKYTDEIAAQICERIAGSESLKSICAEPDMPCESTVRGWLAKGDKGEEPFVRFLRQYVRAREDQADTDADDINDIGRKTLKGEYDPQAARVAIDALKWSAGKRNPKKYGDKVTNEHTGPDGGPIESSVRVVFVSPEGE